MIPSYVDFRQDHASVKYFRDKNTRDIFREDEITDWGPMEPYDIPPMLRQTGTGRIFPWTIYLAKRKDMESYFPAETDTASPVIPEITPANDPAVADTITYMQEQINRLAEDNRVLRDRNRELATKKMKKAKKRVAPSKQDVTETLNKIMGEDPKPEA